MKNNLLDDKKPVYTSIIPIRWSDMDAMGHVNNVVYFRYMEQARIEWYAHMGRAAGMETVIVNAHCSFQNPLTYPGDIEVRTYAGSPGRSSFEIIQEIRRTDQPDIVCAYGGAKVVWIDQNTGKSTPLPDLIRTLITV